MSVTGKVGEEVWPDIFKVQTKFGNALVWFDEELYINVKPGMEFHVDDGPIVFMEGQVVSNITKGVMFWLEGRRYEINEPK